MKPKPVVTKVLRREKPEALPADVRELIQIVAALGRQLVRTHFTGSFQPKTLP